MYYDLTTTFAVTKTDVSILMNFSLNVWVFLFDCCTLYFGTAMGLGDTWPNLMGCREF